MASPMQRVSALVSADIDNYLTNKQTWSGITFNVKSYGAKGDGETDDTAALQKALNEGAGNTVLFPLGTYIVSSSLIVQSGTTLMSFVESGASIKANSSFPDNVPILWNKTRGGSVDTYYDENISIVNLTFDGNNNAGRTVEMVTFLKARNISIERCHFQNASFIGIASGGCFNFKIIDSYFTKTGNPVISSEGGASVWVAVHGDGSQTKNAILMRCTFENTEWSGTYFMPINGIIQDCTFLNCKESSIFTNHLGKNIRYVNNYIYGATRKDISASGIETGANECTMIGNQILNCQSNGISLTDTQNVTISDNVIMNNGQDGTAFPDASGIGIITTETSPNQPRHIKIKGNRIGDDQTVKTQVYGITVGNSGSAVEYVEIVDNDLTDNKTSATNITASKWGTGCRTTDNAGHASATPYVMQLHPPMTTGNYSITGVGFKPRLIELSVVVPGTTKLEYGIGKATAAANFAIYATAVDGVSTRSSIRPNVVAAVYDEAGGAVFEAVFVSMDPDGFTINITVANAQPWILFTAHP